MVQSYVPRGDVDVLGVRMLLTVECVATTACVVVWVVVAVVLTAVCDAVVRAEGRCGCAGSADVLTAECVATTVCVGMVSRECCADRNVWCSRTCRGEMWM